MATRKVRLSNGELLVLVEENDGLSICNRGMWIATVRFNGVLVSSDSLNGPEILTKGLIREDDNPVAPDEPQHPSSRYLPDKDICMVWKCPECGSSEEVNPDFFEDSGNPMCCDCDLELQYVGTYLLSEV